MTSEVKNRKDRKAPAGKEFKPAQFINYSLTETDKTQFAAWLRQLEGNEWDIVDKVVDGGYSITVKNDTFNDCVGCFLSTPDEKSENYGFILTGRGRSGRMALFGALFRHLVLFEQDWPTDTVRRNVLDDD